MADALSGILDVGAKAAHGFALVGSPGYRAGQQVQLQINEQQRTKQREQLSLYLNILKDRTGSWSKEAQKAAGDSIRRLPIFKSIADRLGGGRLRGEGGGAFGGIPPGMITSKVEVGKEGLPSYTFEPEQKFGAIPGAYGLVPEEKRAALAEEAIVKPATQIIMSSTERQKIAETRASIDALDNLKSLFDSAQTKTGPITGRISPIAGLVGMTTDEQESFMAATSAFKNAIIKEITGAQMSEQEASRIMKQIPDITDPSPRWKAKWEQSKKNLEFLQKRRLEILEQSGLRVPRAGGEKENVFISSPFRSDSFPTAVNPKTGQRLILINNKWVPANKEK